MLLIILMWKGFACSSTVCRLLSTQIRRNMKASICYHETCLSVYGPVSRQCQYVFVVPIACLASNHHRLLHGVLWVGYYTNILLLILSFYLNIVGGHPLSSYYYATEMLALTPIYQPTPTVHTQWTVRSTYIHDHMWSTLFSWLIIHIWLTSICHVWTCIWRVVMMSLCIMWLV